MICSFLPENGFQLANAEQPQGFARHLCPPRARPALERAAECLRRGGLVVYPASTFYALGCLGQNEQAAELVYRIKGRADANPLPLLAASMEQVESAVNLKAMPGDLARRFWPGPLTVLLPAINLAPRAVNSRGLAAIRIDANPLARHLAQLAGGVLTASSANISGKPPAASVTALDPQFLRRLEKLGDKALVLPPCAPWCEPAGGLPSTIVEVLPKTNDNALRVLRAGAISRAALNAAGHAIRD